MSYLLKYGWISRKSILGKLSEYPFYTYGDDAVPSDFNIPEIRIQGDCNSLVSHPIISK